MKIGILLCDDYYPESIETYGFYDDTFKQQLSGIPGLDFHTWRCFLDEFPDNIESCDAWIISGSKWAAYETEAWILRLLKFIRKADAKQVITIGICFGHQAIHQALGGQVRKSDKGWGVGIYETRVKTSYGNLNKGDKLRLIAMHQDQVEKPAPDFISIAGSEFCPNALTVKASHILSMQYHPEFAADFFVHLCQRVSEKIGSDRTRQAINTVNREGTADKNRIDTLIKSFLRTEFRRQPDQS